MGMLFEPIPQLPRLLADDSRSPAIVLAYDKVRFSRSDWTDLDAEFGWFAREYPRIFRHHFGAVEYHLGTIHRTYASFHRSVDRELRSVKDLESLIEFSLEDQRSKVVYWEFEALVNSASSALDVLARLMGPGFAMQTPASFSRFCTAASLGQLGDLFCAAQVNWVNRMKDYRDCFTHYTPADTMLGMRVLRRRSGIWTMYAKLPVNPNAREIALFRFSVRVDLLRYSIALHRQLGRLERASARYVGAAFRRGEFPVRINALIGVGRRKRS